jgi:hypothetical protein
MLTVEKAAIKSEVDGKVFSLDRPARHHDVIKMMVELGYPKPIRGEQGFVLSNGRFTHRIAAKAVAIRANQLLERASKSRRLTSEDVW